MELRRVDPRCVKQNPGNPRKIQPGEMSDAALAASIKAIGILQPPTVSEKDGDLTIVYGARRVRFAINIGMTEIDVLVKEPDHSDPMRAVSENVIRAPMASVDLWREIESLASKNWTEDAIAAALAIPVRRIRQLRLLATVHPAILDRIGAGDMPNERDLRTIASASPTDQASVWKKLKPKRGENVVWWQIAQALAKTRYYARNARFGEDERAAFGIVWQEDLFAEGDDDNRFTIDGEAFVSAQRAWLDANMPKNGVLLEPGSYGEAKLPPKAMRSHSKPKKGDRIGFVIKPNDGSIEEVVYHIPETDPKAGKKGAGATDDDAPAPKQTRPEITRKGTEIIGALRTDALIKSLEVNPCDDATLIGLLALALTARNVSIQTTGSTRSTRVTLAQSITEGGRLTQDVERLRVVARQMLANVLSCTLGHGDSELVARIAGCALGADEHLGDMGDEEFLSCLSKAAIEKVASSLGVLPRPRVKETRAEVIRQAAGSTYNHPAAKFGLSEAEVSLHLEPAPSYSWERNGDGADDHADGEHIEHEDDEIATASTAADAGETDDTIEDNDENAHLDEGEFEPPTAGRRAQKGRQHPAAA